MKTVAEASTKKRMQYINYLKVLYFPTAIIVEHRSHVWGECDPCGGRGGTSGLEIIARLAINQLDPGPGLATSAWNEGYPNVPEDFTITEKAPTRAFSWL